MNRSIFTLGMTISLFLLSTCIAIACTTIDNVIHALGAGFPPNNCNIEVTVSYTGAINSTVHIVVGLETISSGTLNGDGSITLSTINSGYTCGNPFPTIEAYMMTGSSCCGDCPVILPVELSKFEGTLVKNDAFLEWTTDSEENNAGFSIERSFDGRNFQSIGMVDGYGTTETETSYNFRDANVAYRATGPTAYYRLKQLDFDGQFSYSGVVALALGKTKQDFEIVKIHGTRNNSGQVNIFVQNNSYSGKMKVVLSRISGEVVDFRHIQSDEVFNQLDFNLANEQDGMYIISINNGEKIIAEKFVLQSTL